MGGKSSPTREYFYVCLALLMGVGGCAIGEGRREIKTAPAPVLIPEPKPIPPPKILVEPTKIRDQREANEHLSKARELMSRGDYDGALRESQKAVSLAKGEPPADAALFHMALIYAHPKNPKKDNPRAIGLFNRVVKTHPESIWAEQAKIWVAVLDGVEKLKQVDLEIEEKKRDRPR